MKKLLLATTALTLSAGVAAADVSLSGDGRMGFIYDGNDVNLTSRARVTFTLSGETDSGMAFGGSFRADNASGAAAGTAGSVFISGDFGRLAFGDVDGAALAATGDLFAVGLTGLGDNHEMQYISRLMNGIDGTAALALGLPAGPIAIFPYTYNVSGVDTGLSAFPRALYSYSIDGFTAYASVAYSNSSSVTFEGTRTGPFGQPFVSDVSLSIPVDLSLTELAVGASYEIDGFMVAAGYEHTRLKVDGDSSTLAHATVAAGYSMDGIAVKAIVGQALNDLRDIAETNTQYGLGVSGTFDATTVTAFARRDFFRDTHYGVGASYDLGGGASLKGGVQKTNGSDAIADFGVAFSF